MEQSLTLFVIYKHPRDYPDYWVLRRHFAFPGRVEVEEEGKLAHTLDEIRLHVPPGWVNIGRFPEDDPAIYEVWI